MAFVVKDRVKETTTTTGNGTITLAGAVTGYRSFADIGNGNNTYYTIAGQTGNEWEVGVGTYTSSGTTLSRDTVLSNSLGTTAKIVFSAGTKDVFVTYPAGKAAYENTDQTITAGGDGAIYLASKTITVNSTIPTGFNGMTPGPITISNGITVTVADGSNWVVT
jgi:hypothetical protein